VISVNPLNFGNFSGASINATSTASVTCTNTLTYNIGLNAGTATGATVTTRKMTSRASATLSYSMYRNAGETLNRGNTPGTDTVLGVAIGSAQTFTIYGQLAAGQSANPAAYFIWIRSSRR
jgi:spore coat protein U-like protein